MNYVIYKSFYKKKTLPTLIPERDIKLCEIWTVRFGYLSVEKSLINIIIKLEKKVIIVKNTQESFYQAKEIFR